MPPAGHVGKGRSPPGWVENATGRPVDAFAGRPLVSGGAAQNAPARVLRGSQRRLPLADAFLGIGGDDCWRGQLGTANNRAAPFADTRVPTTPPAAGGGADLHQCGTEDSGLSRESPIVMFAPAFVGAEMVPTSGWLKVELALKTSHLCGPSLCELFARTGHDPCARMICRNALGIVGGLVIGPHDMDGAAPC